MLKMSLESDYPKPALGELFIDSGTYTVIIRISEDGFFIKFSK